MSDAMALKPYANDSHDVMAATTGSSANWRAYGS